VTAPAPAETPTRTNNPIIHRWCRECRWTICEIRRCDKPRTPPPDAIKCAVCIDDDVALQHRHTCKGSV
jgi:hypothetical protein